MSGACDGAVDMYQSFKGQPAGWYPTCGTSEATPEFAGIVALADQVAHRKLGLINPDLYLLSSAHAKGIVDVTRGNTSVSFRPGAGNKLFNVRGFTAGRGYDLASGVGTVNAPAFVTELALMASHAELDPPRTSPGPGQAALTRRTTTAVTRERCGRCFVLSRLSWFSERSS